MNSLSCKRMHWLMLNHLRNKSSVVEKYGYKLNDSTGYFEKDKSTTGILNIGIATIPQPLQDSLTLFFKNKSKKQMISDGFQLSKHLKNRGRPTHYTWSKYKQQMRGKKEERIKVKKFHIKEAINEGLIPPDKDLEIISNEDTSQAQTISSKQRKQKQPQLTEYSMIRYAERETNAYIASRIPSVYGATYRVLSEIKKRALDYEPKTLLDFGSGCGMTVWAGNSVWGKAIKEYQCVDASEYMNNAAEFLLRGSSDINVPLKIPNVYFKRFLPLSNQVTYDVVVSAYSLTEMPFRSQRLQAIRTLWRKTNDFLVIIETGNNEGFDTTLCAREFIINHTGHNDLMHADELLDDPFNEFDVHNSMQEDEGHVFAPCPHEQTCARAFVETRDQPCNFNQKVELSLAQHKSKLKRYGYYDEKFSYIVLRKGKPNSANEGNPKKAWSRLLQPVKARKHHLICELCSSNGNIEKHILTKTKNQYVYKAARHQLRSGDILPTDECNRPMNIRRPIFPKDQNNDG